MWEDQATCWPELTESSLTQRQEFSLLKRSSKRKKRDPVNLRVRLEIKGMQTIFKALLPSSVLEQSHQLKCSPSGTWKEASFLLSHQPSDGAEIKGWIYATRTPLCGFRMGGGVKAPEGTFQTWTKQRWVNRKSFQTALSAQMPDSHVINQRNLTSAGESGRYPCTPHSHPGSKLSVWACEEAKWPQMR